MINIKNFYKKWSERFVGAIATLGAIYGFLTNPLELEIFLLGRVISAILFAISSSAIAAIFLLPFSIMIKAAAYSLESNEKPFFQGVNFIYMIAVLAVMFGSVLDYALFGGIFLIEPAFSLLMNGTLDSTIWKCEHYIFDGYPNGCAD
jgi:hypothetical protein